MITILHLVITESQRRCTLLFTAYRWNNWDSKTSVAEVHLKPLWSITRVSFSVLFLEVTSSPLWLPIRETYDMFSLEQDGYFPYTVKCPLLFKAEICSRITVEVEVKEREWSDPSGVSKSVTSMFVALVSKRGFPHYCDLPFIALLLFFFNWHSYGFLFLCMWLPQQYFHKVLHLCVSALFPKPSCWQFG